MCETSSNKYEQCILFRCKLYNLLLIFNAVRAVGNSKHNFLNNPQELFKQAFHCD